MLAVERLSVRFGRVTALRDVSLVATPGERLGLVGPNGAGKTTLLDAISGFVRPDAGEVRLAERRLTGLSPDEVARAGVGRGFQTPRRFARLSLAANVRAGRPLDPRPWLRAAGLDARCDDLADTLTASEARRTELARILAGRPRLLLLDEPFGGLTQVETETMIRLLADAAAPDRITVLVDHKLGAVTRCCDRVLVLHLGEKVFDGPAARLREDARVLEVYLGRSRV
jgi:ABC-type branched-subunit amino acid transport system ATPase component